MEYTAHPPAPWSGCTLGSKEQAVEKRHIPPEFTAPDLPAGPPAVLR